VAPKLSHRRQFNAAKMNRAGIRFTALEQHQMMTTGPKPASVAGVGRFSFPDFNDRVRAVHLRVEKTLAFGVVKSRPSVFALKIKADSACLPDDDG
jgi:hypothetical protein